MGAIYHNHGSMRAHSSSLGPQRPDIAQQVCTKGEMTCVQIPRRHLAQPTQNGHFCIVMNDGFTLTFIVKIVSKDHQTLFQSTWKKVNKMKNEGWGGGGCPTSVLDHSIGHFHLGSLAWKFPSGNFHWMKNYMLKNRFVRWPTPHIVEQNVAIHCQSSPMSGYKVQLDNFVASPDGGDHCSLAGGDHEVQLVEEAWGGPFHP